MRKSFGIVLVVWLTSVALGLMVNEIIKAELTGTVRPSLPSAFAGFVNTYVGPIGYFAMVMIVMVMWAGPFALIIMLFIPKSKPRAKAAPDDSCPHQPSSATD